EVVNVTAGNNGPYTTPTGYTVVDPPGAGVYHWKATFSGDANNNGPVSSACGDEPVTITVTPTLSTSQTPTTGTVGPVWTDWATLAGPSTRLGTGLFPFRRFAPGDNLSPYTTLFRSEVVNVTAGNNGPYTTPTGYTVVDPPGAGVYHWKATFSG